MPPRKTGAAKRTPAAKTEPKHFLRSVRGIPSRVTFSETSDRRMNLAPRGQRRDMSHVSEEEMTDSAFHDNLGIIFELIDEAEHTRVLDLQATNQQVDDARVAHPAQSALLNPLGRPYAHEAVVAPDNKATAIPVGEVHSDPSAQPNRQEVITRGVAPAQPPLPGSQANPLPDASPFLHPGEYAAQQADAAARGNAEGLEGGIAGFSVQVAPKQVGQ